MATSKRITLCLIFLLMADVAHVTDVSQSPPDDQAHGFVSANVGDAVTLFCSHQDDYGMHFNWYKQTFGRKPQLLSSYMKYDEKAIFHHQFKDDARFSVQHGRGINHLKINDLRYSDSATYYCGITGRVIVHIVEFEKGITLYVKDPKSKIQAVVQQPVSESAQPGDSVTLNCTVHTETCDGEHTVFWFIGSGASRPGIVYMPRHGDGSPQCERSSRTPTQSCMYNLPKQNLTFSDAGTYYCAVASCGEILFGNGMKADIEEGDFPAQMRILVFLSIVRTGVFLCCLLILSFLYMTRK